MSTNDNFSDSQAVLNYLVHDFVVQQKRDRRWRFMKRGLYLLLVVFIIARLVMVYVDEQKITAKPHVGLIDIKGEIAENAPANADNFSKGLGRAYKNPQMKALIVRLNSPGGSPVQADYMFNTLGYYQQQYPAVKVYAVCVDSCVSAAYYVAARADEVYANPASMVGSIGVIYSGFGFSHVMDKLGVTRRLYTAGKYKGLLDPFSAEVPGQKLFLQHMLDQIHQQFIEKVKLGRGSRLKIDENTFSGLPWTGIEGKERGLIDGFASSGEVLRDHIHLEDVIDYTEKPNLIDQVSQHIGASMNLVFGSQFDELKLH
jgi:protease-4